MTQKRKISHVRKSWQKLSESSKVMFRKFCWCEYLDSVKTRKWLAHIAVGLRLIYSSKIIGVLWHQKVVGFLRIQLLHFILYSTQNFLPKKLSLSSQKYGFGIRDPGSGKPIPDPGSRGQKGTGSWTPDPDPQHCSEAWNRGSGSGSTLKMSWIRNTGDNIFMYN